MTTNKIDYKKEFPDLYLPKTKGMIIDIPPIPYIMVRGKGDPNEENGAYKQTMQILYGLSFTIKMSKKGTHIIEGYHDYVVPPLEGLWWMNDLDYIDFEHKEKFEWISMIRLPDYATKEVFDWACGELRKKHPEIDFSHTTYEVFEEGICAQIMHKGPYDEEPATIEKLHRFIEEEGYVVDVDSIATTGQLRKHHELYLSDPRKSKPENLKTVIRLPIRKGD